MRVSAAILAAVLVILSACGGKNNVREPEYRDIRNIHMITFGPLQSTAGVDIIYYNPNSFGVQVVSGRGDIYIDSVFFGRFELDQTVKVRKQSEFILPTTVKIDMISAIKNQRDLFKKKEALLKIDGVATVKKTGFTREVPIKYEHMESIERFRTLITTTPQQ